MAVGPRATVALSGHPATAALPDPELGGGESASVTFEIRRLSLKMALRCRLLLNPTTAFLLSAALLSSFSPSEPAFLK